MLRRINSKAVTMSVKEEIKIAVGAMQTCSGIEGGIEAAIHVMKESFGEESCDAILLVDATKAFNNLNRQTALHNIKQLCPSYYKFLRNSYETPTRLFVNGTYNIILSQEGTTQGDPAAMAMYALGIRPLMDKLAERLDASAKQVWYADDSSVCGSLSAIQEWWTQLKEGPKYGYYPNTRKTVLIIKKADKLPQASKMFKSEGIQMTRWGQTSRSSNWERRFQRKIREGKGGEVGSRRKRNSTHRRRTPTSIH